MLQYSFDADFRSVLQRLASIWPTKTSGTKVANRPGSRAKLIQFHRSGQQPRLEIAHVGLRRRSREAHDAAP
jgi:hypothetical protein